MKTGMLKKSGTVSLFTREWIEIVIDGNIEISDYVSLFTREWIEISSRSTYVCTAGVSLFTREWIEISSAVVSQDPDIKSPSLRGSGLKYKPDFGKLFNVRLPLYEGVD